MSSPAVWLSWRISPDSRLPYPPGASLCPQGDMRAKYSISQVQLRINQLVEVLRLISLGAMNCAPTFECEMLKPISRGAIHRARSRPPFVTVFAK